MKNDQNWGRERPRSAVQFVAKLANHEFCKLPKVWKNAFAALSANGVSARGRAAREGPMGAAGRGGPEGGYEN